MPSANLATLLLLVQVGIVALFLWRFWSIVDALHTFVTQAPGASLIALSPANRPEHSMFGRGISRQVLLFGAAWYWVLKNARRAAERDAMLLIAIGVMITALSLFFGQVMPFRILYHSEAERVSYQSQTCHMVAQTAVEGLLFCPQQPLAWNRVVRLDDSNLRREGVYESIFTGLTGTK